jgi:hypothetical protein
MLREMTAHIVRSCKGVGDLGVNVCAVTVQLTPQFVQLADGNDIDPSATIIYNMNITM